MFPITYLYILLNVVLIVREAYGLLDSNIKDAFYTFFLCAYAEF